VYIFTGTLPLVMFVLMGIALSSSVVYFFQTQKNPG